MTRLHPLFEEINRRHLGIEPEEPMKEFCGIIRDMAIGKDKDNENYN